jgi:hypothetical protein
MLAKKRQPRTTRTTPNDREKDFPWAYFALSRFLPFSVPLQIVKEHGALLEAQRLEHGHYTTLWWEHKLKLYSRQSRRI